MSLRAGPGTSGRPLGGLQPAPRGCPAAPRGGPRPVSGLGTSKAGQGSMQSPRWQPLASRGGQPPGGCPACRAIWAQPSWEGG